MLWSKLRKQPHRCPNPLNPLPNLLNHRRQQLNLADLLLLRRQHPHLSTNMHRNPAVTSPNLGVPLLLVECDAGSESLKLTTTVGQGRVTITSQSHIMEDPPCVTSTSQRASKFMIYLYKYKVHRSPPYDINTFLNCPNSTSSPVSVTAYSLTPAAIVEPKAYINSTPLSAVT